MKVMIFLMMNLSSPMRSILTFNFIDRDNLHGLFNNATGARGKCLSHADDLLFFFKPPSSSLC